MYPWLHVQGITLYCKKNIAQDPLLGRDFDHKRLVILTEPLEKKVKMTRGKLYFKVRKLAK